MIQKKLRTREQGPLHDDAGQPPRGPCDCPSTRRLESALLVPETGPEQLRKRGGLVPRSWRVQAAAR